MKVSAAAILAVGWMPVLPSLPLLLAVAILAALLYRRYPQAAGPLLCLLLGASYATLWGQQLLAQRLPTALENQTLEAALTVLEPPQLRASRGGQRQRFAADVVLTRCPDTVTDCRRAIGRVWMSYYGPQPLKAAQRWQARIKLKAPRGLANPGSGNYESWLARGRFSATGYLREQALTRLPDASGLWHQRWRQRVADGLNAHVKDASRGVLLALSNGDRSALSQQDWQRFQRYGLNHLVVISGLHVGLVAGLGFLLGRSFGRRSAHLGAAALALLYSALAGFSLPTQRALVMLASVQLVALAGRRLRPERSLAAALLAVALLDPLATFSAGFWLSFGAVAIIFYLHHMHPALPGWRFTLLLQLVLAPSMGLLASFWFGGMGWLAPVANLIAVPVLSFWLAPLCLLAALLAPLGLAGPLWDLAALPVQGFFALDDVLGGAFWLRYRPTLPAVLALAVAVLLLAAHRQLPLRGAAVLFLALALLSRPPPPGRDELQLWMLDVGQGLAVVVRQGGFTLVYDTGAGDPVGPNMASSVILPFLQHQGVSQIDVLVISHGDNDHASGAATLLDALPVAQLWYGEVLRQALQRLGGEPQRFDEEPQRFDEEPQRIDEEPQRFDGEPQRFDGEPQLLPYVRPCQPGRHRFGALTLTVLWPLDQTGSGNNRSCVLRLDFDGYRILLPGDIETDVEHALLRHQRERLRADVLLLPHHGSRSSSSSAFLAAVAPQVVLLSRGYRNRFGHPHPIVLKRLEVFGLSACDSSEQGAVQVRLQAGAPVTISGWRERQRYYWSAPASPACVAAYNGAQVVVSGR